MSPAMGRVGRYWNRANRNEESRLVFANPVRRVGWYLNRASRNEEGRLAFESCQPQ